MDKFQVQLHKSTMHIFYNHHIQTNHENILFYFQKLPSLRLGNTKIKIASRKLVITNQSKTPVKFDHNSATDFLNTGTPGSFIYFIGFTTSQNTKTLKKHIWVLAHCYSKLSSKDKDSNEAIYLGKQFSSAKRA